MAWKFGKARFGMLASYSGDNDLYTVMSIQFSTVAEAGDGVRELIDLPLDGLEK